MPRPALSLLLIALMAGCAATGKEAATAPETAARIFDVRESRLIGEDEFMEALAAADYVLLGERHGNPEHHRLQARIVRALQERSPSARAVAFEMMGTDQQMAIVDHLKGRPQDAAGLGGTLAWEKSGWPAWEMYAPIAQAALDAGGLIVAANLPGAQVRDVFQQGSSALRPALVQRTGLNEGLPEVLATGLRDDLAQAHCGHAPAEVVDGMFRVQRARDAIMADRLVAASGTGGGILIAGAEHVRTDRGVPWYLARLKPGARIVSVAFMEAPRDVEEVPARDLPFDYVWFTPRVEAGDPCAGLRERFAKQKDERAAEPEDTSR